MRAGSEKPDPSELGRSMGGGINNTSFISRHYALHYALDLYAVVGGSRPNKGVAQSRKKLVRARRPLWGSSAVNDDSAQHIIDPAHGL